jgi:hypothetical protein
MVLEGGRVTCTIEAWHLRLATQDDTPFGSWDPAAT